MWVFERLLLAIVLAGGCEAAAAQEPPAPDALFEMSIQELANVEVTIVAKKPQARSEVAAAVDVVTGEELRRFGATSFAEALRLAPGVHVARANSGRWAVGIRGFTSTLSRSMLVLMDGRSVYTPLFAGVYWETQDTLLVDVDRIEVVRGPGGTLWGANAVNGIVNLITKSARQTQGLYLEAGGGTEERGFGAVRYGGLIGDSGAYRVYGKYFDRGPAFHPDGRDFDAWRLGQGGFRVDWNAGPRDAFTIQGDAFGGRLGQRRNVAQFTPPYRQTVESDGRASGANLLGRWSRDLGDGARVDGRVYYDRTDRTEAYLDESRDTVDVDLQHRFPWSGRHELVWGVGYRLSADRTTGVPTPFFDPQDRTDQLVTGFVQDEIRFADDRLRASVGVKAEHNDYTGFEVQPSGRLWWRFRPDQSAWVAVSRAVRTPSRADADQMQTVYLGPTQPLFLRAVGDKEFRSETALVYEAGYRIQPSPRLEIDVAGFYDRYDDLLGGRIGTPFVETSFGPTHVVVPVLFGNLLKAQTYGSELTVDANPWRRARVSASYAFLRVVVHPKAVVPGLTPDTNDRSSPRHQVQLRSSLDLPRRTSVDVSLRHVSALPAQGVSSYTSLDLRLGWRPVPRLELSLVGQNLLDPRHREFGGGVEIERGVFARAAWGW